MFTKWVFSRQLPAMPRTALVKPRNANKDQQVPFSLEPPPPPSLKAPIAEARSATKKPRGISRSGKHERLLRRAEVQHLTGLSRSSLYRKIAAHEFSAPIQISEKSVAWIESEVELWIARKIAASRGAGSNPSPKTVGGRE